MVHLDVPFSFLLNGYSLSCAQSRSMGGAMLFAGPSSALFVNKNYLSDLFGKRLNMSFTQYRNFKRISHAEHLMKDKLLNMTDIAFACGFESLSRFSKVFKQFKGLSPLQYKEQNDEREIK